jgi:hypothetical protein
LLTSWRAAQFADYPGYLDTFAKSFRRKLVSSPRAKAAFIAFAPFAGATMLTIVSVDSTGRNATAYAKLRYAAQGRNDTLVVQTLPRAFRLVREGRTWRLLNDDVMQGLIPPSLRHR